ncbi:uncharacterized protein si:dkey-96f10.1 isoform X3 [Ctenopharyngodon idella]|uniref:uncharacterized protein si:dkey-96f10.1 isoform X3 n=1 Tax=Ctenopharyngodon idella TaxID=7959 RepID=UPI002232488F|nr:uncharacterized protein si:dkey-96f10.1 isoform X3 [Ctenopharyngodon idella]
MHFQMHLSPGLVRSDRPEGHVLSCFDSASTQTLPTVCVQGSGISVQSPTLRAGPVAPCLYEGCGGGHCSAQGTGRSHSQLPQRLAHSGQLAGAVVRTQGHGVSSVGSSGQLGQEQTSPRAEDLLSWYGTGLGRPDSVPHRGARPVSVELPEYAQAQYSGPTETFSEAPGTYGIRSCSHATRIASHEAASALAPRPGPEMGVAEWYVLCPHDTELPSHPHSVVRPLVPASRSSPRTSVQACCGVHRCFCHWVGSHVQQACSFGSVDGASTALAYQLPQVASSTSCTGLLQGAVDRQARTGPLGQHCNRCVHQPSGWSTLTSHFATRLPSLAIESEASEVASCHSRPRSAQLCSQRALTAASASRRMETPSPGGPADLAALRGCTGSIP